MKRVKQYSTFLVDRLHFGVPVELVQEALLPMPTTSVPLTTRVVDGLINLRGQIVMAVDMRARLQLAPRAEGEPSVSLILRTSDGLLSLRVDRLGDVLDLDALAMQTLGRAAAEEDETETAENAAEELELPVWENLPDTVQGPLRELVHGIIKLDRSLLLVLDPALLARPEVCLIGEIA